ncbi:hypothetical protein M408DRAFT_232453 [Serendipita vermifera MAFF 305830]|uniref:Uncharacterized protein n=1 Tax=Serendipita vermifera MAFF 305830 TaxID=933852 RepID=A0A0C2X5C7_SERVB|nr:hypothetical protein M408DRAFT_232453 [Serendipita vermifera MAFF 305830]
MLLANNFVIKLLLLPNEERPSDDEAWPHRWLAGCDVEIKETSWLKYVALSSDRVTIPYPGPSNQWPQP